LEKIIFSCTIENKSDFEDLGLEFWLDDEKFFDNTVKKGDTSVNYEFIEDEADHSLKVVLKNKITDHTTVDESGTIVSDALISIKDIEFNEINIDQLFYENAVYTHDYNGSGKVVEEKFYGDLGCNGEVILDFYTPFYIWLLENM
jgi:hypothetical protein